MDNNAPEIGLRHAVILRSFQGASQSDHGSRWIERILSVRETMCPQDRLVLDYLIHAATAVRYRPPGPRPSRRALIPHASGQLAAYPH